MRQMRTPIGFRALLGTTVLLAAISTLLSTQVARVAGRTVSSLELIVINMSYWGLWALFAPLIVRVTQRFPFERRNWVRPLAVHVPLAFAFSAVHVLVFQGVRRGIATAGGRPVPASFWRGVQASGLGTLDWNMMAYWMIVGAGLAVAYREEVRLREMATARLETQLVQAQLRALQSQLHPHFLFNALNAVSALMHRDVELAERTLSRLADLLRATLQDVNRQDAPLGEELEFTRNYLQIEQTRFGDRLAVRYDIAPEALDASVPWMLLQPLVENAVKHGIAPRGQPGTIEIVARRERSRLCLAVRDDGVGIAADGRGWHDGIGLTNTRARLQHQFGDDHEFELIALDRGVEVRVGIPWRVRGAEAQHRDAEGH